MCSQVHLRMCTVIKSLVINKMEVGLFECSICNHYTATTMAAVLKHVGCVHAHELNFHIICGIMNVLVPTRIIIHFGNILPETIQIAFPVVK